MAERREWASTESDVDTVLILGDISPGEYPSFAIAHFGQDAYETYQLAIYTKELVRVRSTDYICWAPGFRTFARMGMHLLERSHTIVIQDFGSTLFSTVDKFEKILQPAGVDTRNRLVFQGIEVSDLFAQVATHLHPDRGITHFRTWQDAPRIGTSPLLLRSYQATSYGFTSTADLADWMARADISLQGLWVSAQAGERTISWSGKRLHLFDFDQLRERLAAQGVHLAIMKSDAYFVRGENYMAVWFLTYRPETIPLARLEEEFLGETGVPLDEATTQRLSNGQDVSGHHKGTSLDCNETSKGAMTLNFNSIALLEAYDTFRGKSR